MKKVAKVAKVAKVVKDYLEIGFSMKNVLLFTAFLVAAPLLIGERMRRYERESFKDLLIDYSSTILKQKKDVSIQSQHQILIEKVSKALSCISIDETKVKPFICIQSLLSDNAIDADCSEIKNQLLAINDQYIPSEDELLKRRLENPTDLDILDFTLIFSPNESIAVNHMAELIDKKIERSKAFTQLEQQDSSLKAKYLHDIICSFFVGDSWLNGLFISDITKDQDRLNSDIKSCSSLSDIDKNSIDKCLEIRDFIKKHTSRLDSDDKQRIAHLMINAIDANIDYNEEKIAYKNSLKHLYMQD